MTFAAEMHPENLHQHAATNHCEITHEDARNLTQWDAPEPNSDTNDSWPRAIVRGSDNASETPLPADSPLMKLAVNHLTPCTLMPTSPRLGLYSDIHPVGFDYSSIMGWKAQSCYRADRT